MPVSCSFTNHDGEIVNLYVPRKVVSGKMKASDKLPMSTRGFVLSEAFCDNSEREKP